MTPIMEETVAVTTPVEDQTQRIQAEDQTQRMQKGSLLEPQMAENQEMQQMAEMPVETIWVVALQPRLLVPLALRRRIPAQSRLLVFILRLKWNTLIRWNLLRRLKWSFHFNEGPILL